MCWRPGKNCVSAILWLLTLHSCSRKPMGLNVNAHHHFEIWRSPIRNRNKNWRMSVFSILGDTRRGGHGLTMYDGGSGEHDMARVDRPSCLALNVVGFSSFVLLHLPWIYSDRNYAHQVRKPIVVVFNSGAWWAWNHPAQWVLSLFSRFRPIYGQSKLNGSNVSKRVLGDS